MKPIYKVEPVVRTVAYCPECDKRGVKVELTPADKDSEARGWTWFCPTCEYGN